MAPDFEDRETEKLAADVARLRGESPKEELLGFMETEIWPLIPVENRGGPAITKAEKEEALGYGPEGF
jgi:hypothetical protein